MLSDADVVLLSLLAESPRHGYDLDRLIEARGYREWTSLAFSSIYYVLSRLAERGLIAPVPPDTGRRTVYALTGTGRQQLRAAADDRVRRPDRPSAGVLPALGAYESLDDPELRARLAERATALTEHVDWLRSASRDAPHPTARAIVDFEIARHLAELDWVRHLTDRSAATTDETEGPTMKYDRKNDRKDLYQPGRAEFVEVDVPETTYLAIDGHGDPNTSRTYAEAVESLYATAYGVRACFTARTGSTFVVGPMEGLWSGSDPTSFVAGDKSDWDWTMLIALPEPVTVDDVERGQAAVTQKKPRLPIAAIYRLVITEGPCLQIMHVGSYDEEAPTLARLHHEVMPSRGLTWNGRHHEIYLSDPRRTAPQELRTVLRQPVQPVVPLPHPASAG